MTTTTRSFRVGVVLLLSALAPAGALVAACSNNDSNPQPPVYQVGSDGGSDGTVDSAAPQTDTGSNADVQQNQPDGDLQDGELLPDQDAAACTTDGGCWSCIPTSTPQFLNQCTGAQCSPFDNVQRLPDYDGSLPPLN